MLFGFTFQDVAREFPEKNRVHLARILAEMVDKRDGRRYAMKNTPGQLPYYLIGAKTLLILAPE